MLSKEAFAGHGTWVVARWEESGDEATRKYWSLIKGKAKVCAHDNDNRFDLRERSNVGTMLPISPASWAMSWDKPEKVKHSKWKYEIKYRHYGRDTVHRHLVCQLEYKEKLGVLRFLWRNPAQGPYWRRYTDDVTCYVFTGTWCSWLSHPLSITGRLLRGVLGSIPSVSNIFPSLPGDSLSCNLSTCQIVCSNFILFTILTIILRRPPIFVDWQVLFTMGCGRLFL